MAVLEKEITVHILLQVQEFIVNKDPTLLDNFLDVSLVETVCPLNRS